MKKGSLKQYIHFNEVLSRLDDMALPDFDLVVGIAEGGKVPAALIAAKLRCSLKIIKISFRDSSNTPMFDIPRVISDIEQQEIKGRTLLLVDDVCVTGKTIDRAKSLLSGAKIKTFVMKGRADYVLFPEIQICVNWPWNVNPF